MVSIATTCLVVVALLGVRCSAKFEKLHIKHDKRASFVLEAFGFDAGGKAEIDLTDISITTQSGEEITDYQNDVGIIMSTADADVVMRLEAQGTEQQTCLRDDLNIDVVWDFPLRPGNIHGEYEVVEPGMYSFFFYNCVKYTNPNSGAEVTAHSNFKMEMTLYNEYGDSKVYISVGDAPLPSIWFMFSLLFTVMLVYWIWTVKANWPHRHAIHHLMTSVLALKIVTMFCDGLRISFEKTHGKNSAWDVIWLILYSAKTILLFVVLVLIGSGWSFVKPFLSTRDKRIIMIVLPLQVINQIALIVTEEENQGAQNWASWRDIMHLFDIICCCAILFPIVWSIKHLRESAATDGKAALSVEKLTLFRQFYMTVVLYIYFTRIIVFLLGSTLPYRLTFVSTVATQGATALFYAWTGYKFAPKDANPYLKLSQEDEDDLRDLESVALDNEK